MLNRELEVTLNLAFKEARAKRHEFMTVEHLLLALLDNEAAATVLRSCGANLDKLRHDLQEFIDSTTPLIPQHDEDRETQPTLGFQRVLQRAVFHVQSSGKREVTGANVLVAIFSEQESQAVFLLKQQSVARIDVVNYIAHGISKVPGHADHSDSEVKNPTQFLPSAKGFLGVVGLGIGLQFSFHQGILGHHFGNLGNCGKTNRDNLRQSNYGG